MLGNELEALKEHAIKSGFDFTGFQAVDFNWHAGKPFEHHGGGGDLNARPAKSGRRLPHSKTPARALECASLLVLSRLATFSRPPDPITNPAARDMQQKVFGHFPEADFAR